MKKSTRCIVFVFAAVAFAPLPFARAQAKPAANDKAEIEALEKGFFAAFNSRDADAVMAFYAPGNQLYVFDATPPRAYVGWDAYKKDWQEMFATYAKISMRMVEQHITVADSMAYNYSIQSGTLVDKAGKKTEMTVRVTDVYRKTNGKWLIVHEHVSFPVDPATGKADMMSKP